MGSAAHAVTDSISAELSEVVVYGKYDPNREVIPTQSLSGERLETLNSHSVADAVRYFSGVQLKDYGGVGGVKTLDIRSMGSNHLGVFYDGIQLGNAQNGQIDLGKFSLDNIEEISLYNGQKSNIFQNAKDFGSAGTIYIRTKRPKFAAGKRFNFTAKMRTGSFGLANPSARLEYRLSNSVSASFNAEYTYANGKYKFRYHKIFSDGTLAWDTVATRRNGDVQALRLEGALFGKTRRSEWYAKLYYYDSERGIPGAIVNNVWKSSQRQWDRNFFAQGTWQRQITSRYKAMVNFKYAHDYMRYLNPDTTLMYLDNTFNQNEIYVTTAHCYELMRGWDANISVDYQWNDLHSNMTSFASPIRNTLLAAAATSFRRGHFKAQASLLFTYVNDRSKIVNGTTYLGDRRNNLRRFTPALFLSYKPLLNRDFTLRGFYKRIFRMPTFNDLYYTDIGNADLRPEYATQYDLGVNWIIRPAEGVIGSFELNADGYHNRISDKIIAVPKGTGQYRWMMMNIGKVRIWGTDISAQTVFTLPADITLNLRLVYTYQRAMDYSDPTDNDKPAGTYRGQIAYIPFHSGSVAASLFWHDFNVNYSFIYTGERYHTSSNILANYEQPWYTHDVSFSYRLPLKRVAMKALLEINNLFNQQYEVILNYPMPGRNFRVSLQLDI
jgi:outer membrane cobalamin receptor